MTRLAILSDIHGNLPALEAVLTDLAQFKIDQTIVPGDVVNWGPFSAQVMERVVREGWQVVRGNNEFYLLDYNTPRAPIEWNDAGKFPLLPWLHRQLNGRWQNVIAGWSDSLSLQFSDAPPIRVFHGSPRDNKEPIFPITPAREVQALLAGVEETTIIAAHTHTSPWTGKLDAGISSILVRLAFRLMGYSRRVTCFWTGTRMAGTRPGDV